MQSFKNIDLEIHWVILSDSAFLTTIIQIMKGQQTSVKFSRIRTQAFGMGSGDTSQHCLI